MRPANAIATISGISMISHSHFSVPSVFSGATDLTNTGNRNIGPSSMKLARNTYSRNRRKRRSAASRRHAPGLAFSRMVDWFGMRNTTPVVSRISVAQQGNISPSSASGPGSTASRNSGKPKQVMRKPTEPKERTHSKCELCDRYNTPRLSAIPCGMRLV